MAAPAVVDGTVASHQHRPLVASYLNDTASLRTPVSGTFTSYNQIPLSVPAASAFRQLCMPEHAEEVVGKHPPAYKFTPLESTPNLEPATDWTDVAAVCASVTAHDAWPTLIHFRMVERIPLLCGLITKEITVEAWQITDAGNRFTRYTSVTEDQAVRIWKYRWITEGSQPKDTAASSAAAVSESKSAQDVAASSTSASAVPSLPSSCVVHEYIVGVIRTTLFRGIAERECRVMSAKHMAGYASLPFDKRGGQQEENK